MLYSFDGIDSPARLSQFIFKFRLKRMKAFAAPVAWRCGSKGRALMLKYLWIVIVALPLHAQLAPPSGWTSQDIGDAVVMRSPEENPSARVALTVLPPGRPIGEAKSWFGKQVLMMAQASGRPLGNTAVMEPQPGIFVRAVQVENQNHVKVRQVFYGYPVAHGLEVAVLTIPPAVSDQDPQLETANHYVQELAAKRFELAVTAPAQGSGTAPTNHGQYITPLGRTDIDLTYHAKSIIPEERDVPLKGVYVFVGFAYGASYGGVGTTMKWGQQAVQQLLLLFANGVAAKTDLRGGNLAGKYQAEGFATMDVANPAAVSGAPFGRWSEDGNVVHIQWNIGAPTDLAKNGDNLEARGEKWTPFHLPDGDVLEGTFVRKMEAGLRSQAIVLRKDGTFVGDGVNVTMGGSVVNPAFPERGAGTYEVHKGSMILSFSNGFTQAIACVIDKFPNGEAKVVLLNGFPFERVR